jgi:putative aldouronate transport system permease protein
VTALDHPPRPRLGLLARIRRDRVLLLLMLPGVAYFLVFQYGALIGNVIAFLDYVPFLGIGGSAWAGLDNFAALFADPAFWHALATTISLAALQLLFFFPVPLALALLLHSLVLTKVRRFVQAVVYLPHFVSWVIAVALFGQLLGATGVLPGLLGNDVHLVNVMSEPALFQPMMVIELIWKDCGWGTVIFLAALALVDEQLHEAAALDGAGPWRRLWHVTLPSLRPVIVLLLIMRVGDVFSVGFDQVLNQRNAYGPQVAEVLDTYVYFHGVSQGDWSAGAAAGIFKGLIGLALVVAANKIAHVLGEQGVYQ